ncbi:hypothetical protein SAMN05421827_14111 [Pedobacter terrae]|uniref:Uncharacterized protein n=1 Tax=Pedobacter terrae TaxID=405671 RepID=A0A1G8ELY2_9SPHI|nr:hypothetical protein [Pedobacter terrae]SDH70890.1 hypothetical protein SAMN05421827_14111 [Pedobacter terrae]
MKKITLALLVGITLLTCKKNKATSDCGDKICTEEFASIMIKFVDNKGGGAEVKDFNVINQRTGKRMIANSSISTSTTRGVFIIVDDQNKLDLSEQGDDLKITGTSADTQQTKSVVVKVSGGKCACHIVKISGPGQIAFN